MRYTHILLDADDTLFDFHEAERQAISRLIELIGADVTDENIRLYSAINDDWWRRFEKKEVTMPELSAGRFTDFTAALGLSGFDGAELSSSYRRFLGECSVMLDGAYDVLRILSARYKLFIITNGFADVQHSRLARSGIEAFLSGVFISEEIGFSKPSREYFDYVLAHIDTDDKSSILVVGDSLRSDILGGISYGLDTCWLNRRGIDCGDLRPTYTIASIAQLLDILA